VRWTPTMLPSTSWTQATIAGPEVPSRRRRIGAYRSVGGGGRVIARSLRYTATGEAEAGRPARQILAAIRRRIADCRRSSVLIS
jgi:hypothetical protein